jgi:hypothetical protein
MLERSIQEILCIVNRQQNEVLNSFCAWLILSPQDFEKVSSISRDFILQRTLGKECFSGRNVSSLDRRWRESAWMLPIFLGTTNQTSPDSYMQHLL